MCTPRKDIIKSIGSEPRRNGDDDTLDLLYGLCTAGVACVFNGTWFAISPVDVSKTSDESMDTMVDAPEPTSVGMGMGELGGNISVISLIVPSAFN